MRIKFFMIAHFSVGWTKNFCKLFSTSFPNENLLVVDNNPPSKELALSFPWKSKCAVESQWLKSQSDHNITVIRRPDSEFVENVGGTTGLAMNFARDWCLSNNYDYFCMLEPDCVWATGNYDWIEALKKPAKEDKKWVVGQNYFPDGRLAHTPSLWRLDAIKHMSFHQTTKDGDEDHPAHKEHLKQNILYGPENWAIWNVNWDTAQKAWFYCLSKDKAAKTDIPDDRKLIHCWQCSGDFEDRESEILTLLQKINS